MNYSLNFIHHNITDIGVGCNSCDVSLLHESMCIHCCPCRNHIPTVSSNTHVNLILDIGLGLGSDVWCLDFLAETSENKVPGQRQQLIGVTDDPRLNPIKDWNHFNHHTRLIHHGDRDPEYLQDRDPKYLSGEHADSAREKGTYANATQNHTQFIISNE